MYERHYRLLGVAETATLEEIKKAYRAKAFLLHPDKNPHPGAQQEFVELTESYQLLVDLRNNRYRKYTSPFTQPGPSADARREEAKRKAKEYAQMRYEEFERTEAAQTINALNIIFDHLLFLFACSLILLVPFTLTWFFEFTGLILGMLFLLAIGRPIFGYIKHYFKPGELWLALMSLVETYFFRFVILSVANLYILLRVGLQTMLPVYITVSLLIIPALIGYFAVFKNKERKERLFNAICLIPAAVNLLFLLNFWGSRNPKIEEYEIWDEINHNKTSTRHNTFIYLENDAYDNYTGIRIFSDIRQMQNCGHIIYQFEDGLLGVRVMKEYRFTQ